MGSKNHEVVPTPLIAQISGLRGSSGVNKCISNLAKVNLIAKVKNAKCQSRPRFLGIYKEADGAVGKTMGTGLPMAAWITLR
jgi:predicted transcriptional regulator